MLPGHRPCVPIHTGPPDDLGLRHLGDALPLRPALQRNGASVREPPTRLTIRPDHYPRNTLCAHCCWPSVSEIRRRTSLRRVYTTKSTWPRTVPTTCRL